MVASFVIALVSLGGSATLAAPLSADMIVSVPDQVLALVDRGKLIARYSISTSKLPREMLHQIRDLTIVVRNRKLKPEKDRRKDLRKIDSLIVDLVSTIGQKN